MPPELRTPRHVAPGNLTAATAATAAHASSMSCTLTSPEDLPLMTTLSSTADHERRDDAADGQQGVRRLRHDERRSGQASGHTHGHAIDDLALDDLRFFEERIKIVLHQLPRDRGVRPHPAQVDAARTRTPEERETLVSSDAAQQRPSQQAAALDRRRSIASAGDQP